VHSGGVHSGRVESFRKRVYTLCEPSELTTNPALTSCSMQRAESSNRASSMATALASSPTRSPPAQRVNARTKGSQKRDATARCSVK
jgi:hypothetical protein